MILVARSHGASVSKTAAFIKCSSGSRLDWQPENWVWQCQLWASVSSQYWDRTESGKTDTRKQKGNTASNYCRS